MNDKDLEQTCLPPGVKRAPGLCPYCGCNSCQNVWAVSGRTDTAQCSNCKKEFRIVFAQGGLPRGEPIEQAEEPTGDTVAAD